MQKISDLIGKFLIDDECKVLVVTGVEGAGSDAIVIGHNANDDTFRLFDMADMTGAVGPVYATLDDANAANGG